MRKVKKEKKGKRILLCFIILFILVILGVLSANLTTSMIDKDYYDSLAVAGQTIINNKDGYYNTFSFKGGPIFTEYKQDIGSWSQKGYWDGTMADEACGITCISTIVSGYSSYKITPETLRNKYVPRLQGDSIPDALENDFSVSCSDFMYDTTYFTKEVFSKQLEEKGPILICVTNKPSSRWTSGSHYMVLLAVNEQGDFYVSNPKSNIDSQKKSNWYKPSVILPYVVKTVFING